MRIASHLLVALAAAMTATSGGQATDLPAQATPNPPETTVTGVTIVGRRTPEPDRLPTFVARFVKSHGAPGRIGQLSRWSTAVCPTTQGLPSPSFNNFVTARVVEIAASVGAPTSKDPGCRANVLVIFTTKPQTLLDDVRRNHPELLGFHYQAQAARLATFKRPIQAWYVTGTKARGDAVYIDSEFGGMPAGNPGSRLTAELSSELSLVPVVVDSAKVAGHEIGAIADHVPMLALARPSPPTRCSELPSILDVMNPDCQGTAGVEAITIYDTAYLKGLYAVDPEAFLAAQRSEIGSRMMRELTPPAPQVP